MARYIMKPAPVEAIQWTGMNWDKVHKWVIARKVSGTCIVHPPRDGLIRLQTDLIDGFLTASDWLICNENGVVFMANDETFQDRYEFVEDELDPDGGTAEKPLH